MTTGQKMPACEMTMGEYRNYFKCGKPAKFKKSKSDGGREMNLCGLHARALKRRRPHEQVTPLEQPQ